MGCRDPRSETVPMMTPRAVDCCIADGPAASPTGVPAASTTDASSERTTDTESEADAGSRRS